jgi:hypothetical protein
MSRTIGLNQRLVLRAFQLLEAKHGRCAEFTARQLIDVIWFEVERLSSHHLEPELAVKVRQIQAAHARVKAWKRRKGTKLRSERSWSLGVESLNPARCFRSLSKHGLVQRTGRTLALTEAGRQAIEQHLRGFEWCSEHVPPGERRSRVSGERIDRRIGASL